MQPLYSYKVGERYHPDRTSWPESPQYNYRAGAHMLDLFYRNLSASEIDDIRFAPVELAINTQASKDVIFFLYRFGSAPWSDAPYTWHMVTKDEQTMPATLADGEGQLLSVTLVEATNGIIRALRVVSMSPHFSRKLHDAIRAQAARPFDQATYDAELARCYQRYPDSQALLAGAVRTHGGD